MKLRTVQVHHLGFELQESTHQPVHDHPDPPSPLGMDQLLVDLHEILEDLQVLQVKDGLVLEDLQLVPVMFMRVCRNLNPDQVLESSVSYRPVSVTNRDRTLLLSDPGLFWTLQDSSGPADTKTKLSFELFLKIFFVLF